MDNATSVPWVRVCVSGNQILEDPRYNKGLAFTRPERAILRIDGLLPPRVETQDEQVLRAKSWLDNAHSDIERYEYLCTIQRRNERLYYRILHDYLPSLMPVVYTPTVGLACQRFGREYRHSQGMYISFEMRGHVLNALRNWHEDDVRGIVFTDGERILGLGDLGAYGMGIPIGKLSLYTACAGIPPSMLLPVLLDVGTNNEELLADPVYTGLRHKRIRGPEYDAFVDEFIEAVQVRFGRSTLLQWEDFGNANAFRLLEKYRDVVCTYNDDIQGTAAVVVSGILAAQRIHKKPLSEQKFLMYGAGAAGLGIANMIAFFVAKDSECTIEQARKHIVLVDSRGLVTVDRPSGGVSAQKAIFAYDGDEKEVTDLEAIVRLCRPTAIIGVTAQPQTFTKGVCTAMLDNAEHPLIFPLSNPTSKAECTAEQAYEWSNGRCIFASGSPFKPVLIDEQTHVPGQGNNSYIFPGLSLGIIAVRAYRVSDEMLAAASRTLAECVTDEMTSEGLIYPPLSMMRSVSLRIACAVADMAYTQGYARRTPRPDSIKEYIKDRLYKLEYPNYAYNQL